MAVASFSENFYFVMYGVGLGWLLWYNPKPIGKYILICCSVLCYNSWLRHVLKRKRPFAALDIEPLISHKANGSCPSNHAASSMVISLAFMTINPYVSLILLVLSLFTGLSRVCVGVHYPFDVVLGWLIGGVTGLVGFVLFR